MLAPQPIAFLAPSDSAQAVTTVYTASLLVIAPLCIAAIAAFLLRRESAAARVLVWRSALAALLLIFVGRQLPLQWVAWVVPSALATPLVALGRVQVMTAPGAAGHSDLVVRGLFAAYLSGVLIVVAVTLMGWLRMSRIANRGAPVRDDDWREALRDAKAATGVARRLRFVATPEISVPMTWGLLRPVVLIPSRALYWPTERCRIVLLHELSHVAAVDWGFNLLARAACAVFWFHPAAWWIARELRADCELACDDRVIAAGVRRSDYAELLVDAADRFLSFAPALPLSGRSGRAGLRPRLAAILDARRVVVPLGRRWVVAAALSTGVVVAPMSVVQLAPTRDVLTSLIGDARWESRAYAVIGLAQRADSVAVARSVAERDPNPRVRAWARYALEQRGDVVGLRGILRQ
jgi:beta-lactamase regulating signal transducer with metallopeptidase domain